MSLILRPARQSDAVISALLLVETNGDFGLQVLGLGDPALQIKAMQEWFLAGANRFSHEEAWIAEKYGVAAGLLLCFEGSRLTALELGCARRLAAIYGLGGAIRMLWRNNQLACRKDAEPDEYLISHLAVDEHFRRQGIAKVLLEKAADLARAKGLHKLVLEVEANNQPAVALYQRAGFEVIDTLRPHDPKGLLRSFEYFKMLKSV